MDVKRNAEDILRTRGYRYNFDRMAYYNRDAKKVFSFEWIHDHTEEELLAALAEGHAAEEWRIYADVKPSQAVIDAFLAEVNG
jgi:hypothetical protein